MKKDLENLEFSSPEGDWYRKGLQRLKCTLMGACDHMWKTEEKLKQSVQEIVESQQKGGAIQYVILT